jgi:cleavage and polyadenylation specificity factor subunit 2
MITFTPLVGSAQSAGGGTPLCYLAQVDDVRILLDCGQPDIDAEIDWEVYAQAIRK